MRSITTTAIAAGLFLTIASSAQALPITDIYTPLGGTQTLSFGNPISYQHNLIDDGFDPINDILGSVTLTLSLAGAGGQQLSVQLDGNPGFTGSLNTLLLGQPLSVTLSYLQNNGLLDVLLTKTGNNSSDFTFTGSTLVAQAPATIGGTGVVATPEPASLLLFGSGVVLVARRLRRRKVAA